MKKAHLRKKIILFDKNKKVNIIILTVIMLILSLVMIFKFINKKVSPIIMNYAELEARKLATLVINSSINKNISNKIKSEEIFLITKDSRSIRKHLFPTNLLLRISSHESMHYKDYIFFLLTRTMEAAQGPGK